MSTTSTAASTFSTDLPDRPLSCISGLDPDGGSACGDHSDWDTSPSSGFYTVCCDGDIIDFTGFNSYPNYTLKLENLLCCTHEDPDRKGPLDETKGCANNGASKPLSLLLATSTEVAKPWTTEVGGTTSTVKAECFWSQLGLDEMATTSSSRASASPPAVSSISATTISQALSPSSSDVGSSAATTSQLTSSASVAITSDARTTQSTTPVSTGLAAAVVLPSWILPIFLLLSLGLNF